MAGNTTIYLETGSVSPYYNLAFEEYVLTRRTAGDYLMLWQNDNTVVIGQNQNTLAEIDRAAAERYGVNVVRRTTGGGAVYHDLGNLNYSFITDEDGAQKVAYEKFTSPIVEALRSLGLDAETSGRNDILVSGRKVSGVAQRYYRGRVLHHGTLLFCEDLDRANEVPRPDPEKIRAKGVQSVRSRIGNIGEMLAAPMTLQEFWTYIRERLTMEGFEEGTLGPEELAEVDTLCREKYSTWEWNYGASWACDYTNKKRFPGGTLEPRVSLEHGRIREIVFCGDVMSLQPLTELTDALKGCEFRRDAVAEVLDRFRLAPFFGSITKDEVLETLFD